jgi:ABC-type uncharacterized transport system substrate-binding protein
MNNFSKHGEDCSRKSRVGEKPAPMKIDWKPILFAMKRMLLGVFLILLASSILLFSNRSKSSVTMTGKKKINLYFVGYADSPMNEDALRGVLDGINEMGWVQGKDCRIIVRNAQGDMTTLNSIIDDIIQDKPDLLFTSSTPTLQVAIKKITDIPIVFTNSADPIAAGAGESFENHKPNVTGISCMSDFDGMIRFVRRLLPGSRKIGTLFVPGEINSVVYRDHLNAAAHRSSIELESVPVDSPSEISGAAQVLCSKEPDAICQVADNMTGASTAGIIQQARISRIPIFLFLADPVKDGALAAVARDYYQAGRDAFHVAMRILRGENPSGIPIRFTSKTRIVVNLEAARHFNIRISREILQQADEIVGKKELTL